MWWVLRNWYEEVCLHPLNDLTSLFSPGPISSFTTRTLLRHWLVQSEPGLPGRHTKPFNYRLGSTFTYDQIYPDSKPTYYGTLLMKIFARPPPSRRIIFDSGLERSLQEFSPDSERYNTISPHVPLRLPWFCRLKISPMTSAHTRLPVSYPKYDLNSPVRPPHTRLVLHSPINSYSFARVCSSTQKILVLGYSHSGRDIQTIGSLLALSQRFSMPGRTNCAFFPTSTKVPQSSPGFFISIERFLLASHTPSTLAKRTQEVFISCPGNFCRRFCGELRFYILIITFYRSFW